MVIEFQRTAAGDLQLQEKAPGSGRCENLHGAATDPISGIFLDMLQRKVMVEEKEVLLTAREFDILAVMARHPGRVYTYAQICRMIYGETDVGEEMYSSAYCLISGLRKKLEKEPRHPRYLDTVYGVGYRFEIA